MERKEIDEVECPECNGLGYTTGSDHGCYGDEKVCARTCPIPVQVPCDFCGGAGIVDSIYMEEMSARNE